MGSTRAEELGGAGGVGSRSEGRGGGGGGVEFMQHFVPAIGQMPLLGEKKLQRSGAGECRAAVQGDGAVAVWAT